MQGSVSLFGFCPFVPSLTSMFQLCASQRDTNAKGVGWLLSAVTYLSSRNWQPLLSSIQSSLKLSFHIRFRNTKYQQKCLPSSQTLPPLLSQPTLMRGGLPATAKSLLEAGWSAAQLLALRRARPQTSEPTSRLGRPLADIPLPTSQNR